jgi:hypothetical protein
MNNFILMFGEPTIADTHTGTMPQGVILTEQKTFKAIHKRKYLGTFKDIEQAIKAVNNQIKKTP